MYLIYSVSIFNYHQESSSSHQAVMGAVLIYVAAWLIFYSQ